MAWTVALGLGMWAAAAFQDSPAPLPVLVWGVLGMLHVLVPLDEWRRVAPFVLLGWCVGHWNLATMRSEMILNDTNSPTLRQLDCRPTFTPSLGKANQHGVFCCRNEFGHMERMWLGVPDTAIRGAGPMWIRVTSPRRFDLSDAFDFPAHLSSLGVTRVGQFLGSTNVESRPSTPATLASRWRTWVRRTFSTDESGLVLGMFAGDRKSVSPEVQHALRQLGLSHLLAVSGYHVSLVSLLFFLLMQRQQRSLRWGSVFGVPMVWAFVAATGWSLSAIRAATMATLGWWFLVRGKSLNTWGLLGAAGCVVAVLDPMSPRQLGAQLSFAATAALMALQGKHVAWRVPLRAQWATLPWNVHDFQTFPFLFYPANVVSAVAVWGLACCAVGAACGLEWFKLGLAEFGERALVMAAWINGLDGLTWRLGWVKRAGLSPLVWGTALLWLCPLLPGRHRRLWVRHAMGVAVLVGTGVNVAFKCRTSDNNLGQRLWHVSARESTWLMEDGWHGEVWASSPRDSVKAANVVHHQGLSHVTWNTTWTGPNATKSQPPSGVWDFGQNPAGTCEVSLGMEISSVSEAE